MTVPPIRSNFTVVKPPVHPVMRFSGERSWKGSSAIELPAWAQKENAYAREQVAAVVKRQAAAAEAERNRPRLNLPSVDFVFRPGNRQVNLQQFETTRFYYRDADGQEKAFTGADVLNALLTPEAVSIRGLERERDHRGTLAPDLFHRFGRTYNDVEQDLMAELGIPGSMRHKISEALQIGFGKGAIAKLYKPAPNPHQGGTLYYCVPQEVRAMMDTSARKKDPDTLVGMLKSFLSRPHVIQSPDPDLTGAVAQTARSLATFKGTGLPGFGYGDVPVELRQTEAFHNASSDKSPSDALLDLLLNAANQPEPDILQDVVALCKEAVEVGLMPKRELNQELENLSPMLSA